MGAAHPPPDSPLVVRDTIYEQLGPADRSRLHRSVADLRIAQRSGRFADLMATCSKKRQSYVFSGDPNRPQIQVSNHAELETYYRGLIDSRTWMLHYDLDKVTVGDDEIVLDGVLHQLYPTELVNRAFPFQLDPGYRAYQLTKRLCVIFLFDEEGLSAGEQAYSRGPIGPENFTPVEDEHLPALFRAAA